MSKVIKDVNLDKYVCLREIDDDGTPRDVRIIPKEMLPPNSRKTGKKFGLKVPIPEYVVGTQKGLDAYFGIVEKLKKHEQLQKNGRTDFISWQPRRGG